MSVCTVCPATKYLPQNSFFLVPQGVAGQTGGRTGQEQNLFLKKHVLGTEQRLSKISSCLPLGGQDWFPPKQSFGKKGASFVRGRTGTGTLPDEKNPVSVKKN